MTKTKIPAAPKANPALAATEKARKAAVAGIDSRLAKGAQDHEEPSPKEKANNAANLAAARANKGPKGQTGGRKAKAPAKRAHGPTSRPTAGAKRPLAKAKAPRGPKRLSALDAAAQVLASAKSPMRAKELIDAMSSKGLWKSPGGKTPEATLYAAIIREIAKRGTAARFKKLERGVFVAGPAKKGA